MKKFSNYAKNEWYDIVTIFCFIITIALIIFVFFEYLIKPSMSYEVIEHKEEIVFEVNDIPYEESEEIVEGYYADETYYEEPMYSDPVYQNYDGLTASKGVNYHNGRKETYYSSNVLYHYRTSEWTVDEYGVYRDSDGYVVVAASDLEQGAEVDTSFGIGKVYDSGCSAGTTDIYTNW